MKLDKEMTQGQTMKMNKAIPKTMNVKELEMQLHQTVNHHHQQKIRLQESKTMKTTDLS